MSIPKERIDVLLVEQGYYTSREKAKAAIMAGLVLANAERIEKAGMKVPRDAAITVKGAVHPYVSRGGLKLEKAIQQFGLNMQDAVMLDIGASTGGFTDCALQNGAQKVYAVDVGYNQLDWSLRNDDRVIVMERTNFRYTEPGDLVGPVPDTASIDVSFISLKLILPPLARLLAKPGRVVALIKPQFEAGREKVGKSGIVREASTHEQVLREILDFAASIGFQLEGLTYSPITGGEGNIEFLAYWNVPELTEEEVPHVSRDLIADIVREAHTTFRS
ncbi:MULTISPECIES: TlyA family RNA methyltransferase [Paenibacillus]|uniref:TlyA family RNA methyltransferase n=2 Tax=Paenibacillus TaxID=44249 RepID=A0AAJ2JS65_9BACL|nr:MULTISPECIES: TlyA family RNA methyltransferase [Paenibacillus]MCM3289670.1 TlyA family RNA methyltransferase [Paenibacillus sp. MER 180]MDT8976000.1 TlyA family RNA methyltransferase [Paenibacillus sp. chi10]OBY77743.1 RNA methyltransferase [Paenibacillus sp. KS1]TQR46960.1 TlyA family RNA methyltransferase [Paenibacillus sp. SDF0028]GAV11043.1 hemolysin TlyA family protein [Paenibacillus sp. NAIST15-1]